MVLLLLVFHKTDKLLNHALLVQSTNSFIFHLEPIPGETVQEGGDTQYWKKAENKTKKPPEKGDLLHGEFIA